MTESPGSDPDLAHEEFETIPWAMLADHMEQRRLGSYVRYGVAGLAFVVIVFLGLGPLRSSPGTVVDLDAVSEGATTTSSATSGAPDEAVAEATSPPAASGTSPAEVLYSEADLMAVLPATVESQERAHDVAAGMAEWFVRDYFTAGGSDGPVSWVEWARSGSIETVGDGAMLVTVGFQMLLCDGNGVYRRTPAHAVVVRVRTVEGRIVVTDRPRPAGSLWDKGQIEMPEPLRGDVPQDVAAEAKQAAAGFGDDVRIVGGNRLENGSWLVDIEVVDAPGLAWIYSVMVEA